MAMDVEIKTPDGVCDAALIHPAGEGRWPAVLVWPDAYGLRPTFREMGARLAGEGYVVLVVNQFYRSRKAPVFAGPVNFSEPKTREALMELRKPLTPETVARDGAAFLAFLDGQKVVNARAKAGVAGYCMGGAMTLQAAAALPSRIGAGCSFHGGGLVTDGPDSPHLLVPRIKASYYFGVAANDDAKEPQAKEVLKAAFAAAKVPARIEVYSESQHGWCVPDSPVYNKPDAERAWGEMLALYKAALV
ncbi:dienelactone hydrolase family protein [Phenylobacterium sp.]|jgi:carboxymethylenebutenolidase|uniref:dienelactone hydrolase family protein n=1 Tax=Phenylobacterium sp. TaxID=1871053 RepID=UPI002F3EF71E